MFGCWIWSFFASSGDASNQPFFPGCALASSLRAARDAFQETWLEVVFTLLSLGLGRGTALATALLLLNDGHRRGDELDTPVTAVGPGVEFAVVVQVILAVELVFAAELAGKAVGSFAMESKVHMLGHDFFIRLGRESCPPKKKNSRLFVSL